MSNNPTFLKNTTECTQRNNFPIEKEIDRIILSLMNKGLSPAGISRHLKEIGIPDIKPHKIREVLLKYVPKIEKINRKFDEIASRSISIVEWDETFKGHKYKVLVVLDSITGYVFLVERIAERSADCIKDILAPLKPALRKAQIVLTDGAPYFPKVVKELCPYAKHQICLAHVMRGVHAKLRKVRAPYSEALSEVKGLREKLHGQEQTLRKKRYERKKKYQKLQYHKKKREDLRKKFGVEEGEKGIYAKFPQLEENYKDINRARGELRSKIKTVKREVRIISVAREELKEEERQLHILWAEYMKECKVKTAFYDLFLYREEEFKKKKAALIEKLEEEPSNEMRTHILRLLKEIPGLDAINRAKNALPLKRNFMNTNAIESFNSRIRPLLNSLRNVSNSPYCEERIQLFRLHVNADPPHQSSRDSNSPIERYGYDLRGCSSVGLIIDGLPPGPQSQIFLPNLNSDLMSRKLVKDSLFSQA